MCNDPNIGDLIYWKAGTKGKFKIRSALSIMRQENDTLDDELWDLVWTAPIQQRIRAFLWIVSHDRLMGNANRHKRYMTDDPKCFICGWNEETTLHILRDGPAAKFVWRRLGGPPRSAQFFEGHLRPWLITNLSHLNAGDGPVWLIYYDITLWWIWRWRNYFVFNRRNQSPIDVGAFLQVRYDEARRCFEGCTEGGPTDSAPKCEILIN